MATRSPKRSSKGSHRNFNADVDESLFGLSKADKIKQNKQNTPLSKQKQNDLNKLKTSGAAIISNATLQKLTSPNSKSSADSVVITSRELKNIKTLSSTQRLRNNETNS